MSEPSVTQENPLKMV